MTLQGYIDTIRRMTRYAPLSDDDIKKEVNNVKDTLFAIAPFYIKTSFLDTEPYKESHPFSNDTEPAVQIISVNYYPYPSTALSADETPTDTIINVSSVAGFPSSGDLIVEEDYNTEVIHYPAVDTNNNTFGTTDNGVTRGAEGSVAKAFKTGAFVRLWKSGYKWDNIEALTEISLFEDERKFLNVGGLSTDNVVADTAKRYFTYSGYEIFVSPPPKRTTRGGLRVVAFHRPPDLTAASDIIKGFPVEMDRLVVLYACRNYWTYFGGEDSFQRLQATEAEFGLLLNQFKERVDFAMKKILTFVTPEIGRKKG